jgi:indolepyruvate ferredoxin oxidoreductase
MQITQPTGLIRDGRQHAEYRQMIEAMLPSMTRGNLGLAVEIASLAEQIRGFGHVKRAAVERFRGARAELLQRYQQVAQQAPGGKHPLPAAVVA